MNFFILLALIVKLFSSFVTFLNVILDYNGVVNSVWKLVANFVLVKFVLVNVRVRAKSRLLRKYLGTHALN